MSALVGLLARRRLIAALAALLLMMGLAAWQTMPRQEDPSFVPRFATLVVPFPGADAHRVERLVLDPLADELASVSELRNVRATARSGVAVLQLQLADDVYATDAAWDEVRRAIDGAVLPSEAGPVRLDDRIGDPASVVLLVTGSSDVLALRDGARRLELALRRVPGVARIDWVADPGATLRVTIDEASSRRLGLEPMALAELLAARNLTLPGGQLAADGRTVVLRPHTELADVQALRATPLPLPGGAAVPLEAVADVALVPTEPAPARLRHDGEPAVGLAVVPDTPRDLVAFGDAVREALAAVDLAPLEVQVFADQPAQVEARLAELTGSLVLGVLVVAGVLFLAMGPRLGAVVASVVPLVALSTLGIYAAGGGVLHQISIAALVLALGLLVDNAIVVAEAVQQALDAGRGATEAAQAAVRDLATPLFTATGTTLAAFAPMLLSSGGTADFTRSIPVVVVLALVLSYIAAVAVTPLVASLALRPSDGTEGRLAPVARRLGRQVTRAPVRVLGTVGLALVATLALLPGVQQAFFPLSDQARVMLSIELPEGTHIDRTDAVVADLAADLGAHPDVLATTAFIGRGPPRFYYNLNDVPAAPHAATLALQVRDRDAVVGVLAAARERARRTPDALVVAKRLQQGPPVGAPVELRLAGDDLVALQQAAESLMAAVRDVPGTADVRTDLGVGVPQLAVAIDDAAAARRGVGRGEVALTLLGATRGLGAGTWTGHWDDVPVEVRGDAGERLPATHLGGLSVRGVPLGQVARTELAWAPAAIHHRDGRRQVRVLAELADGTTFSSVRAALEASGALETMPDGIEATWGGETEGSGEANAALLATLPVGLGLLVLFLLVEFDSFRRAGLVLLTVPLAAVGVVPGLALSGAPFGFMSLLGVIALTGIVVNNAIVLIDRIDRARDEGMGVADAVEDAVAVRLRPILLTTATTVSGMLPLALSSSSLWPPLAWAMISGLVASTALTLLAVPALYVLLFDTDRRRPWRGLPLVGTLLALASPTVAQADTLTLDEVVALAADGPLAEAERAEGRAAGHDGTAAWLGAVAPAVGAELVTVQRDGPVEVDTPLGPLPQRPEQQVDAGLEASLPLLAPAGWAQAVAATRGAKARQGQASRVVQDRQRQAAALALDGQALDARRVALEGYLAALDALAEAMAAREAAGLVVTADRLRVEAERADAGQQHFALAQQRDVLARQLGALLGRDAPVVLAPSEGLRTTAGARPDLDAARHAVAAAGAQRAAVGLEALPEVALYGRVVASDNEALVDPTWLEGGVRATWTLARGTRVPRLAAAGARRQAADARLDALQRQVAVDRAQADADAAIAAQAVTARTLAAAQTREARTVVEARYAQGLASLTDVLQVQAEATAAEAELALARIDTVRAEVTRAWASGGLPD